MLAYIGGGNATPCQKQGIMDWLNEPTPYLTGPSTTPIPGPGPAPTMAPITLYVDAWSPSIPKGRADWIAVGSTVTIPVPANATRYRAWFLPPSRPSPAGSLPNGAPVAFVEPSLGPVPSGGAPLTLTPTWARLNEDDVDANVLRASLVVEFAP